MKTPFSYVVLRYMHDVFTREFVNVGLLLYAPRGEFLAFRRVPRLDRVKGMFPGFESVPLRVLLEFLESRCVEVKERHLRGLDRDSLSADQIANSLLTSDDSALQWSTAGGGSTDDPEASLNELFERLVTRHEKAHPAVRRPDPDVWGSFEREFRKRKALPKLEQRTLEVGRLTHHFQAYGPLSGGHWRLFRPLSFDLVDPSEIVEKAVRWSGLLRQFRKVDPDFCMYFLLGRPADSSHMDAFSQAQEALTEDRDPRKIIIPEERAPAFADELAGEIQAGAN